MSTAGLRRTGRLLAGLALAAGLASRPSPGLARADACADVDGGAYEVALEVDTPRARLHHDRGIADLGRLALHGPRGQVLGLAQTDLTFSWKVGFEHVEVPGGHCFWVRRVALTLHHPVPDIYVAREYPRGGCNYRAILAHEEAHVRTTRTVIDRYRTRLHWVLTSLRIPTAERPRLTDSPEQAEQEIGALMRELAEPVFEEIAGALREAQARLDSPRSYRQVFASCRRW